MVNPVTEGLKAARALRRRLGSGEDGPVDVEWVAQQLGVLVVRKPLTDGLSGIHLAHASGRSFVVVNSTDIATRQNFTLAHELGHATFDRDQVIVEKINFADGPPVEKRANAFAAELILPEKAVRAWHQTPHLRVSPDEVARLALTFHMSYSATVYRLKTCRIIDDVQTFGGVSCVDATLRDLLNARRESRFELPGEFVRMADEALSRSIISRRRHRVLTAPLEGEDTP